MVLAIMLTASLIGFLMVIFFTTPQMTADQRTLVHPLLGVLAGLVVFVWGGAASLNLEIGLPLVGKLTTSAAAGILVFLITWFFAPYWYEKSAATSAPPPAELYQADFTQYGTNKQPCFDASPAGVEFHIALTCYHTQNSALIPATYRDMDMHLTVRKLSGSDRAGYGVLLVAKTASYNRQHRFFISGIRNYTYEVASYDQNGHQTDLAEVKPYTFSTAIKPRAANELEVIRKGSVIDFLVNGQRLVSVPTSLDESEEVRPGFQVVTQPDGAGDDAADVAFSDFRIYAVK